METGANDSSNAQHGRSNWAESIHAPAACQATTASQGAFDRLCSRAFIGPSTQRYAALSPIVDIPPAIEIG